MLSPSTHSAHPTDDELSDDALTGRVRVYQRKRGHRYSLDDVLTARLAIEARPEAHACLDLGCGIGSVLLMLADKLPGARLLGIEAQEISHRLALQNIARNALGERVRAQLGDIRDVDLLSAQLQDCAHFAPHGFDLVTGTPPYMPIGTATPSPDSQRAHARVELRGGVEAYLLAAGRMLSQDGVCVVCAQAGAEARVERGAEQAGLQAIARLDAFAAEGRSTALFAVHTLVRKTAGVRTLQVSSPFFARDAHGVRSAAAIELRAFFGHAAPVDEAPSPRLRARGQAEAQER